MGEVVDIAEHRSARLFGRGGLLAQDFPGHIGAEVFASNVSTGCALNSGAVLSWNPAVRVEPGPDAGAVRKAKSRRKRSLAANDLGGSQKSLLLGCEGLRALKHDEVYASHTSAVNASHTDSVGGVYLDGMPRSARKPDQDEAPAKSPAKVAFGARLKAARVNAGHTQESAGAALGVHKVTVSSWELGNNFPDPLTLAELAKLYETTADSLVGLNSSSAEAQRFAAQFDSLPPHDRKRWSALWGAYFDEPAAG